MCQQGSRWEYSCVDHVYPNFDPEKIYMCHWTKNTWPFFFSDKFSTQVEANANAKQTLTYTHDYTRGQQIDDNQFDACK